MKDNGIRDEIIESLQEMYQMDIITNLAEFLEGELKVLFCLVKNDGGSMTPSLLSDCLKVTRGRITVLLSILREKNYITMEISEADRRKMQVSLTAEGKEYVLFKERRAQEYFDLFVSRLGEKDSRELIRIIQKSIQVMEEVRL